jgi:hypothetical protein
MREPGVFDARSVRDVESPSATNPPPKNRPGYGQLWPSAANDSEPGATGPCSCASRTRRLEARGVKFIACACMASPRAPHASPSTRRPRRGPGARSVEPVPRLPRWGPLAQVADQAFRGAQSVQGDIPCGPAAGRSSRGVAATPPVAGGTQQQAGFIPFLFANPGLAAAGAALVAALIVANSLFSTRRRAPCPERAPRGLTDARSHGRRSPSSRSAVGHEACVPGGAPFLVGLLVAAALRPRAEEVVP